MTQTRFFRIVLVLGLLLLGLSFQTADAKPRLISLHQPIEEAPKINISEGSAVKVTNDFKTPLYNLRIVKVSTGKNMLRVDEFQPGQAFDLKFVRKGNYVICYSLYPESESEKNACFQVNVEADFKA